MAYVRDVGAVGSLGASTSPPPPVPAKRAQPVVGTGSSCDVTAHLPTTLATDASRESAMRASASTPAGAAIIIRRAGFADLTNFSSVALDQYDADAVARMVLGGDLLVRDFNNILLAPTVLGNVNPCRFYRPAEYWDGKRPFNTLVQPIYYIIDRTNGPLFTKRIRIGWDPAGAVRLYGADNRRYVIGNGRFYSPRVHAQVDPCFSWVNTDVAVHPHHHIGLAPAARYIRVYNLETGYFSWIGLDHLNRCVSSTTEEGLLGVWDKGAFGEIAALEQQFAYEWDRLRSFKHGTGRECDGGTYTIPEKEGGFGGRGGKEIYSEFIAPTVFALKPDDAGGGEATKVLNFSVHMHGYYPPLPTKITSYGPRSYEVVDLGSRASGRAAKSGTTPSRLPNVWDLVTNGPVPPERASRIPIALHPVAFRVLNVRGTARMALFAFNAAGEAIGASFTDDILAAAKACTKKSKWGSFLKVVKPLVGAIAESVATQFLGAQAGHLAGSLVNVAVTAAEGKNVGPAVMNALSTGLNFYCGGGFALRGVGDIASAAMDAAGPAFEQVSGIPKELYADHLAPIAKTMMPGLNNNLVGSVQRLTGMKFASTLIDKNSGSIRSDAPSVLRRLGLPTSTVDAFDRGMQELAATGTKITSQQLRYFDTQITQVATAGLKAISPQVEDMKSAAGTFVGGGNYAAVNGFDAIVQHQLGGRHPDLEDPTVLDAVQSVYAPPQSAVMSANRLNEIPGEQLRSIETEMWQAASGTSNVGVPYPIDFDDPARRVNGQAVRSNAARSITAATQRGTAEKISQTTYKKAAQDTKAIDNMVRGRTQAGGSGMALAYAAAAVVALALKNR